MMWGYGVHKDGAFADEAQVHVNLDAHSIDPAEAPLDQPDGSDKRGSVNQPQEPAAKKPPGVSPAVSADWHSSLLYQPELRYSPRSPAVLGSSVFLFDPPLATQSRGRKRSSENSNNLNCWLMALMTLNTLAVCVGLWQLRLRASRMMHAQETAIGELSDAIRSRVFPLLDQSLDSSSLSLSPADPLKTPNMYPWTDTTSGLDFQDDEIFFSSAPRATSTQLGSPDAPRARKLTQPADFLLSPMVSSITRHFPNSASFVVATAESVKGDNRGDGSSR